MSVPAVAACKAALLAAAVFAVAALCPPSEGRTAMLMLLGLSALLLAAAGAPTTTPRREAFQETVATAAPTVAAGTPVCSQAPSGVCMQVATETAASRANDLRCKYLMNAFNNGQCGAFTNTGYALLDGGTFRNAGGLSCGEMVNDVAGNECHLMLTDPLVKVDGGVEPSCSLRNTALNPTADMPTGYETPLVRVQRDTAEDTCTLQVRSAVDPKHLQAWMNKVTEQANRKRCEAAAA